MWWKFVKIDVVLNRGSKVIDPFTFLGVTDNPNSARKVSETFAKNEFSLNSKVPSKFSLKAMIVHIWVRIDLPHNLSFFSSICIWHFRLGQPMFDFPLELIKKFLSDYNGLGTICCGNCARNSKWIWTLLLSSIYLATSLQQRRMPFGNCHAYRFLVITS